MLMATVIYIDLMQRYMWWVAYKDFAEIPVTNQPIEIVSIHPDNHRFQAAIYF